MWIIIGLVGFYLIYMLEFRFYLVTMIKMGYSRAIVPMFILNPHAHWIVQGLVILIFCLSTFSFYKANPWAMLLSPVLLLLAMMVHAERQSRRTDKIINLAAGIQASLERQGVKQTQINDAICLAALGEEHGSGTAWDVSELLRSRGFDADWEIKEMVKVTILPNLGLLASRSSIIEHNGIESLAFKQNQKDCQEIDSKIEISLKNSRAREAFC
jgi:hypothetical protein